MCSLRNNSYLLCETLLRSSSSQVKQNVSEITSDLSGFVLIIYLTFSIIMSVPGELHTYEALSSDIQKNILSTLRRLEAVTKLRA